MQRAFAPVVHGRCAHWAVSSWATHVTRPSGAAREPPPSLAAAASHGTICFVAAAAATCTTTATIATAVVPSLFSTIHLAATTGPVPTPPRPFATGAAAAATAAAPAANPIVYICLI